MGYLTELKEATKNLKKIEKNIDLWKGFYQFVKDKHPEIIKEFKENFDNRKSK